MRAIRRRENGRRILKAYAAGNDPRCRHARNPVMSKAFVLTIAAITDADAFARYREAVAEVNAAIGGETIMRGRTVAVLEGDGAASEIAIVIAFPDADAARTYIERSAQYRALAPLRAQAGEFTIRIIG